MTQTIGEFIMTKLSSLNKNSTFITFLHTYIPIIFVGLGIFGLEFTLNTKINFQFKNFTL